MDDDSTEHNWSGGSMYTTVGITVGRHNSSVYVIVHLRDRSEISHR